MLSLQVLVWHKAARFEEKLPFSFCVCYDGFIQRHISPSMFLGLKIWSSEGRTCKTLHKKFSNVFIFFRNSSLTFAVIVVSLCALFLLGFLLLAYRVKARGRKPKFQVILSLLKIFDEMITWSRVMMATSRQIQHQLWLRISPLVLMMAILWKAPLTIRKLCQTL